VPDSPRHGWLRGVLPGPFPGCKNEVGNYSKFTILFKDARVDRLGRPAQRPLVWLGDSKKNIQSFPKGAQKLLGDELQLVQFGSMPKDARPFKGIGSGGY